MTREEIESLKLGYELDVAVAVNIMGWKVDPEESKRCNVAIVEWFEDGLQVWRWFQPSTDIKAAWEVVEKMKEKNWWSVISSESDKWNALFYWDPNQEAIEAESNTATEAICKASLLTVLEESL